MTTFAKHLSPQPSLPGKLTPGLLGAFAVTAAAAALCYYAFMPTDAFVVRTLAAFVAGAACVIGFARRHVAPGAFGQANVVTLWRGALIAPLIGLLGQMPTAALAWFAIAIAIVALILDGVDGRLARRAGQTTPFGARFDMETDAILILALCALCWQFDKAGAWVLAAGLLRYLFVAAAWPLPWMRCPLPASRRRQTVCVVQIIALLACLSPLFPRPWSVAVAAVGLSVLVWSFLIDVVWLARRA
jgi:phosphatidylglycerophosphate synthase